MIDRDDERFNALCKNINELFYRIFSLFPSTYALLKTKEDLDEAKRQWACALVESHTITLCEDKLDTLSFNIGMDALKFLDQPFMPSCGQFIALCKKEDFSE
jgi:hypothetical protein